MNKREKVAAVGRTIQQALDRKGMTRTALSEIVGVSLTHVGRWLDGVRPPKPSRLDQIIEALGLSKSEGESLRRANFEARMNPDGVEFTRRLKRRADLPEGALPVRYVPVISNVAAGEPQLTTDGDYPAGVAEVHLPVPEYLVQNEPGAFILRIDGDSMAPRLNAGDYVLVAPETKLENGQVAVVQVGDEYTCKVWHRRGAEVSLKPYNRDYETQKYRADEITKAYPVILELRFVRR